MSNEESSRFDRNGFAHAITNERLRAAIAATYADANLGERVTVSLPIRCPDPMLYEGLFAKFGGGRPGIVAANEADGFYKVQGEGLTLSGSTGCSICLVTGLTVGDFLPV